MQISSSTDAGTTKPPSSSSKSSAFRELDRDLDLSIARLRFEGQENLDNAMAGTASGEYRDRLGLSSQCGEACGLLLDNLGKFSIFEFAPSNKSSARLLTHLTCGDIDVGESSLSLVFIPILHLSLPKNYRLTLHSINGWIRYLLGRNMYVRRRSWSGRCARIVRPLEVYHGYVTELGIPQHVFLSRIVVLAASSESHRR